MKGIKLTEAVRLLCLVIILVLFLTSVNSSEVPKSETVIIPGELNDSKENAQLFDNELEYVFGTTNIQPRKAMANIQGMNQTNQVDLKESWRKTTFQEAGTLVITLSYDIDSNYSIEVYNSCSNKNYCEEYEFGTYKTCVMNIQPGNYYFKVINLSGSGKYYLDVDLIKNKQKSEINAWECTQVECSQDKDCGTNGFDGEKYCKNNESHQNYITYTCNNPGRDSAICTSAQEEVLIETCNSCFNGECIFGPKLICPKEKINENYLFTWNALNYTSLTSVEFSSTSDFKSKKSVNVKNLKLLPVKSYYSTLMKYETTSKENKVYARLVGKNASREIKYSETCAFNLTQKTNSVLNCPTEPIDESYIFTLENKDGVNPKIQISYVPEFSTGKNFQISTKSNQTPIKTYYSRLLDYEKKSANKKLYAKATGKDKYGRDTSSNTCEFNLKQQIQPTLTCPVQNIDSTYLFNWNGGDYTSSITLELSYKNDFRTKTSIIATKLNPTPITKYFKTLQSYSLKTTTKELFARINAKNKYNQTTSNICTFKLAGTNLSEEEQPNQTAYFKILKKDPIQRLTTPLTHTTTLIKTDANASNTNNETSINDPLMEVSQRINEDGETEEIGTYIISNNQLNSNYLSSPLIEPLGGTTCLMGETGSSPCESDLAAYNITINYTVYDEIRYNYVDCTTGEILGKGQLCPGETSPLHHRPDGHSVRFDYEAYQCTNNSCKVFPVDLCSGVSCSNYCGSNWKYYNGSCSEGVCDYSRTLCAAGCNEGSCKTGCSSGCSNYCNGSRLYYNGSCSGSQCNYSSKICTYGCSNGACKSQTCSTGWKCIDDETKGYRNSDCSWDDEEYCEYGCESGECNDEPISHDYSKCYSGDRYWYTSLDQREEKREDCGEDIEKNWETPYCNGNTLERKRNIIDKYCSSDRCKSSNETETEEIEYCPEGCSNGGCINLPKPGDTDYCTPEKPCQAGVGNCKKNNDCETGLRCVEDMGSKYGYSRNVNVCEAALNIYNTSGWTCKDPNTMAYLLSDGSYTSELPCKHGCSNGSCFMPALCDASTADLLELPKAQKLSFAGIDSNKEKVKRASFYGPVIYVGAIVVDSVFADVVGFSFLALIAATLVTYNNQTYEYTQWPEYKKWAENQLEIHYNKHNSEFGFKDMYEFGDKCRQNYEDSDSLLKEKYIEETSSGKVFIVRSFETYMVSLVNASGELFACYKVGTEGIKNKTKDGRWKPIARLPNCIAII